LRDFTITPLQVGRLCGMDRSVFTYQRNFGVKFDAPCIMWLVSDGRTNVVVDAGPAPPELARPKHPLIQRSDAEAPAPIFQEHGVDPESVELVVLTHLHWDHCGEAAMFKNATFVVQAAELREAVVPVFTQRLIFDVGMPGYPPRWLGVFDRTHVVDGDVELMPGLDLVCLPGHTPGMQGVNVATAKGQYLIAGDAVPLYENWEGDAQLRHIPNGIHADLHSYERAFKRMEEVATHILPGHDPMVFEQRTYP
jgi:glyoxylase-like metal-dependent hydrolase (beta-lactamase superfamily II)